MSPIPYLERNVKLGCQPRPEVHGWPGGLRSRHAECGAVALWLAHAARHARLRLIHVHRRGLQNARGVLLVLRGVARLAAQVGR